MHYTDLRDQTKFTNFCQWIRTNTARDQTISDIDFIHVRFSNGKPPQVMLVEEKQCMRKIPLHQWKVFRLIDLCLYHEHVRNRIQYLGFYLVQMKSTNPGDGIWINGSPVDQRSLAEHLSMRKMCRKRLYFGASEEEAFVDA